MSIYKIMSWDMNIMMNRLQTFEGRPEIFDDFDEQNYEEITFEKA